MKWNITKHTYLIHLMILKPFFFQKYWSFVSHITMIFTVPIQCYLKKKENIKTLLTPQCDFYYHQKFNSYMIFFHYISSINMYISFIKLKKTTTKNNPMFYFRLNYKSLTYTVYSFDKHICYSIINLSI